MSNKEIRENICLKGIAEIFQKNANGKSHYSTNIEQDLITQLFEGFAPNLKNYSGLINCNSESVGQAVINGDRKADIDSHTFLKPKQNPGISINLTLLNNIPFENYANQTKTFLKIINAFFHEKGHIEEFSSFTRSKPNASTFNNLLYHISSAYNPNLYLKNYLKNPNEAFAEIYSAEQTNSFLLKLLNLITNNSEHSKIVCGSIENSINQNFMAKLEKNFNKFLPSETDCEKLINPVFASNLCKSIVSAHPELIEYYDMLGYKYNKDGSEKTLSQLLADKKSILNQSSKPEPETEKLYGALFFQKLHTASIEELEEYNSFCHKNKQEIYSSASTYLSETIKDFHSAYSFYSYHISKKNFKNPKLKSSLINSIDSEYSDAQSLYIGAQTFINSFNPNLEQISLNPNKTFDEHLPE